MSESLDFRSTQIESDQFVIQFKDVCKSFPSTKGSFLQVVDNFTLSVYEGELITVFGPNGAGKTTILNMLAGICNPDSGTITKSVKLIDATPVGYVFQNYSETLLPWRTVRDNVRFPLELRNLSAAQERLRTDAWLAQFNLAEHADKFVYQLSGGLKQLVSIARATIYEPRLLLLDEPFSALDYSVSRRLWRSFRLFWSKVQTTTVFISHNIDEAIFLGDRVCVLSSRPTSVIAEINIPFGPDRALDLLSSTEFYEIRTKVLEAFDRGRK